MSTLVGSIIDGLLERRRGAIYSPKWWRQRHATIHRRCVELACPFCPDPAELGRRMRLGGEVLPMSYNDFKRCWDAAK